MLRRSRGSFRIPDETSRQRATRPNPRGPGQQLARHARHRWEPAGFQVVDTDDDHAGYLLVARPRFGPGLAADEPVDKALIPNREWSFVDGAVRLLTNAAAMFDAVLDSRDAAQTATLPAPAPTRGQPFRSADRTTGTEPQPPDASALAKPRRPRTR